MFWFQKYAIQNIPIDLASGLSLASLVIPQSMAYAALAGMPVEYGLYSSAFPMAVFALCGSNKIMNIGPFALLSLLAKQSVTSLLESLYDVEALSLDETQTIFIHLTLTVSCLAGLAMIIFGAAKVCSRIVDTLLAPPLLSAFTAAASFHILTSQLKGIFGIPVPSHSGLFGAFHSWGYLMKHITSAKITECALFSCSLFIMFIFQQANVYLKRVQTAQLKTSQETEVRFEEEPEEEQVETEPLIRDKKAPVFVFFIPEVLVVVILSSFIVYATGWNIEIINSVPSTLPSPGIPWLFLCPNQVIACPEIHTLLLYALIPAIFLAIFSVLMTCAISKIFPNSPADISLNQDAVAVGLASVLGSFLTSSFLVCGSLSRTALVHQTGGTSPVVGLVASLVVFMTTAFLSHFIRWIPQSVLAAVVVLALSSLSSKFKDGWGLLQEWKTESEALLKRMKLLDCCLFWLTFLSVVVLDVALGLFIGCLFVLLVNAYKKLYLPAPLLMDEEI